MFQWISQLVRDKPEQVTHRPLSEIGQQIQSYYHCGHIRSNRLVFSAEDKRRLRQRAKDEMGLDPFVIEQLPADRLAMAQCHANEKLATKTMGGDPLLLNSADGIIRVNNQQIRLQPESLSAAGLLCLNSSIRSVEHQTIVVVENLAIMPLCHTWRIACVEPQALWVYRGDYKSGAQANTCRDFVERLGTEKTVIVFSDMDPKGLEIALTMPHVDYWLGPEQKSWRTHLCSGLANREGFDLQSGALAYLERLSGEQRQPEAINELLLCMKEERSSYRQEHMFSRRVGLELFAVRAGSLSSVPGADTNTVK